MEKSPEVFRPSRPFSPLAVLLIVTLGPTLAALVALVCAVIGIWLDPDTFGGETQTLYDALRVDSGYIANIVKAALILGTIASVIAALTFSLWRLVWYDSRRD